jgi:hypothetical protein
MLTSSSRLSVFGFLAHPDLSAESAHNSSGNYGLLDQQFALRWVQDNIANFGGNSSQVGSLSLLLWHMLEPKHLRHTQYDEPRHRLSVLMPRV